MFFYSHLVCQLPTVYYSRIGNASRPAAEILMHAQDMRGRRISGGDREGRAANDVISLSFRMFFGGVLRSRVLAQFSSQTTSAN
jgi:hypothetical protein